MQQRDHLVEMVQEQGGLDTAPCEFRAIRMSCLQVAREAVGRVKPRRREMQIELNQLGLVGRGAEPGSLVEQSFCRRPIFLPETQGSELEQNKAVVRMPAQQIAKIGFAVCGVGDAGGDLRQQSQSAYAPGAAPPQTLSLKREARLILAPQPEQKLDQTNRRPRIGRASGPGRRESRQRRHRPVRRLELTALQKVEAHLVRPPRTCCEQAHFEKIAVRQWPLEQFFDG